MQNTSKTQNIATVAGKIVNTFLAIAGSMYCIYGIYWLIQHGYFK
jgi:hypothetical protein